MIHRKRSAFLALYRWQFDFNAKEIFDFIFIWIFFEKIIVDMSLNYYPEAELIDFYKQILKLVSKTNEELKINQILF